MLGVFLVVASLAALLGPGSGERFLTRFQAVSVTIEEDSTELDVLDEKLECPGLHVDFYLGNTEPVPFEIQAFEFFADLSFTRMPDSELGDDVFEVLVVCDDGNPIQPPATATVTVTVTSRNEYEPFAPQDSYSLSFSEASMAGDVVGSLAGSILDGDGGEDGRITFTALNHPPSPYFSIIPETGDLVLLTEVDYERVGELEASLEVHGCDRATPPALCPNITVNISLTSVNDNDPHFLQAQYHVFVEEGLHRATEIMTDITCSDEDVGEGSYEGMKVIESSLGLVELTDTASGTARLLLTAATDYDFTNNTEFEAVLSCYDNSEGDEQRTDSVTVKIEVVPANDHWPQFTAKWFNTSVLESLPVKSYLLTATCSDQDRDYGQFSSISLHQPSAAVNLTFSLEPETGRLTLAGTLDYDNPTTRNHVFSIKCSDEGGLEAISRVGISTLPVSDEPLTFPTSAFEFTVDRLTSIDSRIGQVKAIDGDQGEVPVIVYSLESNNLFEIDEEGYIVLTDHLSQDKGSFFNLSVSARDSQGLVEGRVLITVTGPLSIVGVINVVIGGVGIIVVIVIGLMVSLSTYFCWKLYRGRSDGPTTEVPVRYMSGERIPYRRPPSAHSRSSGGGKRASSTLGDRSTLSMQRSGKKKKPQSFKKRARKRVAISDSFFTNSLHREAAYPDDDMGGLNPADFEMSTFKNEGAVRVEEEEKENLELDEGDQSTHNIFNPEDAGLMLGDIMLFPGEEQTRWGQDDDEESGNVVGLGSWNINETRETVTLDKYERSESNSEGGESGEWDLMGSVEWDPNHGEEEEEEDPLTFI